MGLMPFSMPCQMSAQRSDYVFEASIGLLPPGMVSQPGDMGDKISFRGIAAAGATLAINTAFLNQNVAYGRTLLAVEMAA